MRPGFGGQQQQQQTQFPGMQNMGPNSGFPNQTGGMPMQRANMMNGPMNGSHMRPNNMNGMNGMNMGYNNPTSGQSQFGYANGNMMNQQQQSQQQQYYPSQQVRK